MIVRIEKPTEKQVGASGVKAFINGAFIPYVGVIELNCNLPVIEISEGVYSLECEGVLLYEDRVNHFLRLKIE